LDNIFVADSTGLSSTTSRNIVLRTGEFGRITQNKGYYAV